MFLAALIVPVGLGGQLGALLILMLAGATWLPVGSILTYLGNMHGIPVLTALLVATLTFSLWNDNHEIATVSGDKPLPERPTIDAALDTWKDSNCRGESCAPMVVVTTAGGGIRAGYWTATVLGRLHDSIPEFDRQLFAISGVSGGSVGASVYRALLTGEAGAAPKCPHGIEACAQAVLAYDFLGPVSGVISACPPLPK